MPNAKAVCVDLVGAHSTICMSILYRRIRTGQHRGNTQVRTPLSPSTLYCFVPLRKNCFISNRLVVFLSAYTYMHGDTHTEPVGPCTERHQQDHTPHCPELAFISPTQWTFFHASIYVDCGHQRGLLFHMFSVLYFI